MEICIIEGFDGVGKSAVAEDVTLTNSQWGLCSEPITYNYDRKPLDDALGALEGRWLAGYYALDALSCIPEDELDDIRRTMIFDRAIASSWVYDRLYSDGSHITDEIVTRYIDKIHQVHAGVTMILAKHSSKESAKLIYEQKVPLEPLDEFESFEDYWKTYNRCNELYEEFFKKYELPVCRYITISNDTGTRVKVEEVE